MQHVVDQRRPVDVVKLARLIREELLEFDPPLDVGEVEELLVAASALRLEGDQAHRLTNECKLLDLSCALPNLLAATNRLLLLAHHELTEVLLREFHSLSGPIVTDKLNDL